MARLSIRIVAPNNFYGLCERDRKHDFLILVLDIDPMIECDSAVFN